jgi:hypothetical protein
MINLRPTKLVIGLTLAASVMWPSNSLAQQCNTNCSVGALGQGGASSGGAAQGFRYVAPGQVIPGSTVTNVGNFDAGHIDVSLDGDVLGTLDGTYHDGVCIGLATGVFGDLHGRDPNC